LKNLWKEISKEEFDSIILEVGSENLNYHTVMFCSPPVTFIWDIRLSRGSGWEQYDSAILKNKRIELDDDIEQYFVNMSIRRRQYV
jgi:hypothetical protein